MNKEERIRLRQIRVRFQGADAVRQWAALPGPQRDDLIGGLQDEALQQRDDDPVGANARELAIAVLDTASIDGSLGFSLQVVDDVRWLLERIDDR